MPDENRFAGLGEAIDGDGERSTPESPDPDDSPADASEAETPSESESDVDDETVTEGSETGTGGADASPDDDATGEAVDDDAETGDDDDGEADGPAFEFEATTAKSIYVRDETLDRMDDAEFEVESLLRRDHDVRDMTGREFHDALVRVAAEYPDEIVESILIAREE